MTTEQFHVARYNGILSVMKKERDEYRALEKRHKILASEFNILKKTHLSVVDDCIKQRHVMREQIKKLRKQLKLEELLI